MARRLHKTLVDYLVIAISPALIITLIGSLVFFLLEVFYRGQHDVRLHAIFGLFVMATVLIGRIAIEEGKERAHLFAAPLAIVTFLALQKYVHVSAAGPGTLWNVLLIALIWWCAHKVTWDCTLIDEAERDSGEGLLESAGLDRPAVTTAQRDAPQQEETEPEGTTSRDSAASSWWQRVLQRHAAPMPPAFGSSISRWPRCRCSGSDRRWFHRPAGSTRSTCCSFTWPAGWGCCFRPVSSGCAAISASVGWKCPRPWPVCGSPWAAS